MMSNADLGANIEPEIRVQKKVTKPVSDRVKIVLAENDDIPPTGLFVGLNGRGFLIKPGEPVEVPRGVLEILDNAVMSAPQIDPQTRQVMGYRERMRFPYRLVNS
jgi:hypothetical protein